MMKDRDPGGSRNGPDVARKRRHRRQRRPAPSMEFERAAATKGYSHIAGVDEVGRGCLAGPVVAAAVILEPGRRIRGVRDSKVLSSSERERLARLIEQRAIGVGLGICTAVEIDEMNILRASLEAMRRALRSLDPPPDFALVDGNQGLPESPCSFELIVDGDDRCHAIAVASVVAKVARDKMMLDFDKLYPAYRLASNKGYATSAHFDALESIGLSPIHRRTFRWKREHADQIELFANL